MKILITTDLFTTRTNGVVTSVCNLADELTADGHEVKILTLSKNAHSHVDGNVYYIRSVSLEAVYPQVRMPTSYRHRLIRELIAWKPDVIHSQCEFFTFQYALRISRCTGAPIVHTYHTLYEQYASYVLPGKRLGPKVVKALSRYRLKKVKRVIAPTRKVESALRGYGVKSPIRIVPSGIDLTRYRDRIDEATLRATRQSLGLTEENIVLISLGRLGTEKNLDELLRFFVPASDMDSRLRLLIAGDGPARTALEQLAGELGIREKVIFTGMIEPRQVQLYYQLGDVFLNASTSETQGLTYIEASANGLPLLCRRDPCLNGVIREGVNGYTYTCREDFLIALHAICNDPDWRAQAGEEGRQIAAGFDKALFGDNVEAVYAEALR